MRSQAIYCIRQMTTVDVSRGVADPRTRARWRPSHDRPLGGHLQRASIGSL
jgi:lactoylglutathione lyase